MLRVITLLLLLFSINCFGAVGKITEEKGSAEITRSKTKIGAKLNTGIESMDSVETVNGVIGITFDDDTKVRVTEHSKLLIDDFVYDPKSKGVGKIAMRVALGTVRYASGNVAHENNKNVDIKTPTATVAVRGTAFTMTVDEIGQSLVILLPNVDGSVGEIEVQTKTGAVVLNRAFQATMVANSEVRPLKPVILNLSESAIDNMLIIRPPTEITKAIVQQASKGSDALAYTGLDTNYLEIKVLGDALSTDVLNSNALDGNFLSNALDNMIMGAFQAGYNASTQVNIIDKSIYYQVERTVNNNFVVLINKNKTYDITIVQEGKTINLNNSPSALNKIYVNQSTK